MEEVTNPDILMGVSDLESDTDICLSWLVTSEGVRERSHLSVIISRTRTQTKSFELNKTNSRLEQNLLQKSQF